MFGGLDVVVAIFLLGGFLGGIGRGLLGSVADFAAIFLGLVAGSLIYIATCKIL